VNEGDTVSEGQELVRLVRMPGPGPAPTAAGGNVVTLKAPAAGVVTHSAAVVGATASAMPGGPLMRIAVGGAIELEAEVPSVHVPELASGQTARIEVEGQEVSGSVRLCTGSIGPVSG
jgi:HlyD family secretion protein